MIVNTSGGRLPVCFLFGCFFVFCVFFFYFEILFSVGFFCIMLQFAMVNMFEQGYCGKSNIK